MKDAMHSDPSRLVAIADVLLALSHGLRSDQRAFMGLTEREADELARLGGLASDVAVAMRAATVPRERSSNARHEAECARLFDGASTCPPNETAWVRREKGHLLADIAGFYRAFGFRVAAASGEKADHVAVETQFVAVLLVFLARAIDASASEQQTITRDALTSFAEDHLGAWVRAFCAHLGEVSSDPRLAATAVALPSVLDHALESAGCERPHRTAVERPEPCTGSPYECDGC
jgi:TorA maturation chaperone TorD